MKKKEIKNILIDKFIEIRSIDGLIDYLIEKGFLKTEYLVVAQVRKEYFTRAKQEGVKLTQIMCDLSEEFDCSEKTIENYIYNKKRVDF